MFYQCTDNPDLLFQLTRNNRESNDPTIKAKFNSNTIVTTILHYLQENRMMSAIRGTPRTSRQPYSFKNCSATTVPLIPRLPNPAIKQVNYVNNDPMSDYNSYVFGMNCEEVSQIQDCIVYSVAKLTDFLPNALDEDKTQMTDQYIQALAKYAQKPSSLAQECPICLSLEHLFEECEVLGNYEFLKAHMRELSLLWKRLCYMIRKHTEKKAAAKQKKKLNALQALQPPPPQQSESIDDDNSTLSGSLLQGSLASLSLTDDQDFH